MHSRLDGSVDKSVVLLCNTSLSADIMWTYMYDTNDGYVDYVYWNGHIAADKTRLSVKPTGVNVHSLVIDDAEQKDSGLYSCYDGDGLRKVSYQLNIPGMMFT